MASTKDTLEPIVKAFVAGDVQAVLTGLDEGVVVHVPGSNQLSGDYKGHEGFMEFVGKVMGATGGVFALTPHEILGGTGEHATGVYNMKATRDGKAFEWRQVNVYHINGGKVTEVWQSIHEFEAWNRFWQ